MKRRCAFFDRDGVINVKRPEGEYVRNWEEFQFIPRVFDDIRLFDTLGFLVIVVTNQRGISLGRMASADVESLHERMRKELASHNAFIDDVYYCPHDRNSCDCRKPQPGMVLQAQAKWNIDLAHSIMFGDSDSDEQLATNCGMGFVRMLEGKILKTVNCPRERA